MNSKVLDKICVALSIGCALHCTILPLILPLLPLIGFVASHDSHFHLWFGAVVVVGAVLALSLGFRKHRRLLPALFGLGGIIYIIAGNLAEVYEASNAIGSTIVTVFGSFLLIVGHYLNHKYSCRCLHPRHGK